LGGTGTPPELGAGGAYSPQDWGAGGAGCAAAIEDEGKGKMDNGSKEGRYLGR